MDDSFNVFAGITQSSYFIVIIFLIFILQFLFLTFGSQGIRVILWGLDPVGWLISILIGSITLIVGIIAKLIPLEKILPGSGHKELTIKELNKMSTMSIRKRHDSVFYMGQSGLHRKSSAIEDKNLH